MDKSLMMRTVPHSLNPNRIPTLLPAFWIVSFSRFNYYDRTPFSYRTGPHIVEGGVPKPNASSYWALFHSETSWEKRQDDGDGWRVIPAVGLWVVAFVVSRSSLSVDTGNVANVANVANDVQLVICSLLL
ncbi:hypothetical protein E4U55_001760 [Claviceps digitariae]|nr:hypothetical protein E4U55_001760 [Claviceps digitariae]